MEEYLLQCEKNYYWIWRRESKDEKHHIFGPMSEKIINLPIIKVGNPLSFKPEDI